MRMNWPRVITLVALGFGVLACRENITAPAQCPDFCPPERITVVDTILSGIVTGDSSFRGYAVAEDAPVFQLVSEGSVVETRGITRFRPFAEFSVSGGDTLVSVDSIRVTVDVLRRDTMVQDLEVVLYRIPATVDSATTYADLDPYFQDSTRLTTFAVDDSLTGSLEIDFPASLYPGIGPDSTQATIGWALRAPAETFLDLTTGESGQFPLIARHITVLSAIGDTVSTLIGGEFADFDTFVARSGAPLADSLLVVGGVPSARTILRFNLPARIRDSSDILKATLVLIPSSPAAAASGDGGTLRALAVTRDVGQKSPRGEVINFVPGSGAVAVLGGATDTVFLDVTNIMATWTADSILPTTLFLSAAPEAGRMFELRFFSSRTVDAPLLSLSYVPPFLERR